MIRTAAAKRRDAAPAAILGALLTGAHVLLRHAIGSICALSILVAPCELLTPLALAQEASEQAVPPEDARTLFQRGQAAYAQGDYDAAIEHWARAWELDSRPLLQFNLSQAYERLGRLEDAVAALQLYLDHADPTDEHQADARARQSSLRERIARTSVRVQGGPENATILVDDQDRGRTPHPDPLQVTPGAHRIVVRARGYADFTSSVVVPAGQTVDVQVQMARQSAEVASGGGELPVGPVVLFGVGGAAVVAGAIMGAVALTDAQSAFEGTPEADRARGLAIATDVTFAVAAACGAAGLIWLLVAPGGSSSGETQGGETQSAVILPYGSQDGVGVVAGGSF